MPWAYALSSMMIEIQIQMDIRIASVIHIKIYEVSIVIIITMIITTPVLMIAHYIYRNIVSVMITMIMSMSSMMVILYILSLIITIPMWFIVLMLLIMPTMLSLILMPITPMIFCHQRKRETKRENYKEDR